MFFHNVKKAVILGFLLFIYRYDLLCLEGLVQALRIFNEADQIPTYRLADISKESMLKMHVKPEVLILEMKNDHCFSCFMGLDVQGRRKVEMGIPIKERGGWVVGGNGNGLLTKTITLLA